MIRLLPPKRKDWMAEGHRQFDLSQSKPFVESPGGRYTHRVRSGTLFNIHPKAHMAVQAWCGMTLFVAKFNRPPARLVDEPTEGRPVCATCEGRAIGAGQVGSREIAGRPVMFAPHRAPHYL